MTVGLNDIEDTPMRQSHFDVGRPVPFALCVAAIFMGCSSEKPATVENVNKSPANQTPNSESKPPADAMDADENVPPPKLPRSPASQADLDALIARTGSLTLRTNNGEWEGFDGDRDYTFFPNKVITIQMHGLSDDLFRGTYRMDAKGRIEFELVGKEWSPMLLQKDARSILMVYDDDDWPDQRPCRPLVREDKLDEPKG